MDLTQLIDYVRAQQYGVVSTIGPDGAPQSAYLAITATDRGELVFDAKPESRKIANLRGDGRIAVVVGGADRATLQCEGAADLPSGDELERCTAAYLDSFPQFAESITSGRVVVVRIDLRWARFTDFRQSPASVTEVPIPVSGVPAD